MCVCYVFFMPTKNNNVRSRARVNTILNLYFVRSFSSFYVGRTRIHAIRAGAANRGVRVRAYVVYGSATRLRVLERSSSAAETLRLSPSTSTCAGPPRKPARTYRHHSVRARCVALRVCFVRRNFSPTTPHAKVRG